MRSQLLICPFTFDLFFLRFSKKRDRQLHDVSRADGTFATNRLSGQKDWPQRGDRRDNFFREDTDLRMGKSGGLGGRIDNGSPSDIHSRRETGIMWRVGLSLMTNEVVRQ